MIFDIHREPGEFLCVNKQNFIEMYFSRKCTVVTVYCKLQNMSLLSVTKIFCEKIKITFFDKIMSLKHFLIIEKWIENISDICLFYCLEFENKPSKHLLVQKYFTPSSSISVNNFEQVSFAGKKKGAH